MMPNDTQMIKYKQVYMDHFGYGPDDYIPCEICGQAAVDVAHIIAKSKFGSKRKEEQDVISNLMALCRPHHYDYDFRALYTKDQMQEIHNEYLKRHKK